MFGRLLLIGCLSVLTISAASIKNEKSLIEPDSLDDYKLVSPWAVAFDDGDIYFSNFGAPVDSVDWVGKADDDGGDVEKYVAIDDVDDLKIMHIKNIVVVDGDVYATSYGGPSDSHVLQCKKGSCESIYKVDDDNLMPTAIAYSEDVEKLFVALADGNLEDSKIISMTLSGKEVVDYVESGSDTGVAYPVGLAIDDVNKHVYWSNDAGPDQIQRGDLTEDEVDESSVGTIMAEETKFHPHSLAIDVTGYFIYFTDQTSDDHQIGRIDLSGNNLESLYETNQDIPHSIAIDVEEQKLFWSQTGSSTIHSGEVDDIGEAPKGTSPASSLIASFAVILSCLMLFL